MKNLLTSTKGAVTTEYIVIVGTVALGFAVALVSIAPQLLADYYRTQHYVGDPTYPQ